MITVSYLYVPDVIIPGTNLHRKFNRSSSIGTQIGGALLLVILPLAVITNHASFKDIYIPLLFGFFAFVFPFFVSFSLRRRLAKHPQSGLTVQMTFTEEAFSIHTSKSDEKINWDVIQMARLAKEGILIYPQKHIFHWIPRSAFQSSEDFAGCLELIERKIKNIKRKGV